LRGFWCFFWRV